MAPSTQLGIDVGGTSVKIAAVRNGEALWTVRRRYHSPGASDISAAIRDAIGERDTACDAVGLCVPGLLDDRKERVTLSVNVPGLVGMPLSELVARAIGREPSRLYVTNDSIASGYDIFATRRLAGRLLVLALGTGVGAAVLDEGIPLKVDHESPGHIGQLDVSIDHSPVIGPDGGAGSLEGYVGAEAMRRRYGSDPASKLKPGEAPLKALARAIRICHAIYRPHHVVLAGGLGIRLGHLMGPLRKLVETNLTRIAREGWTLGVGDSDYHAARGAARLASAMSQQIA